MADLKITELTATTAPVDADLMPIVTDVSTTPVTKKVTIANLRKAISSYGLFINLIQQTIGSAGTKFCSVGTTGLYDELWQCYMPINKTTTISGMQFYLGSTQSATGTLVITLYNFDQPTGILITVPAGSTQGLYTESSPTTAAFTAGDLLSVKIVNNASATSGALQAISFRSTPT